MTQKQAAQFNRMRSTLPKIAKDYMNPEQMRRACDRGYGAGVSYDECIEMSYENIQNEAKIDVKNVREIKTNNP